MSRPSNIQYYLNIAKSVSLRSPCSRRKFGAIIVLDDDIISTGYNGSARGTHNCGEDFCLKDITGEAHLISYDSCPAIHAEQNAIINADPLRRKGATMYLSSSTEEGGDRPCHLCRRYLIQSRVKDIYYIDKYSRVMHENIESWKNAENLWMDVIRHQHKEV